MQGPHIDYAAAGWGPAADAVATIPAVNLTESGRNPLADEAGSDEASTGARGGPDRRRERLLTDLARPWVERSPRLVESLVYLLALGLGWNFRFIQDDAFITYRYAQNLAKGHGLVLNPGERVEGYTNFLWTVIHAIPERFGWTTPRFGEILGLTIFVVTVAVVLRLFRAIIGDETRAVFAVLVLLGNLSFVGYGTSGMETMLQTLLATAVGFLLMPGITHPRLGLASRRVAAGALGGIALLVRLDTTVLVATWFVVSLVWEWRASSSDDPNSGPVPEGEGDGRVAAAVRGALQMGVPVLVIVVPWLVWKADYYGSLLPNTLAAKTGASLWQPYAYGLFYLAGFLVWYGVFLLIGRWRRHRRSLFALPGVVPAAIVVGVWCLYIVYVGADFMEFRFLVPVLPFLALAAAHLIDRFTSLWREVLLIGVLGVFSLSHAEIDRWAFPVFTFKQLSHWPANYTGSWRQMGEILGDAFPGGLDESGRPLIAVIPLGVIPYYSELPAIDMLGLADEKVAKEGLLSPIYYPGHVRMASIPYLVEREANLVIGEPQIFREVTDAEHERQDSNDRLTPRTTWPGRREYRTGELISIYPVVDLGDLPDTATVIEVPLGNDSFWPIIYLAPNERVDAAIEANGWERFPLVDQCRPGDIDFAAKLVGQDTCD